MIISTKGIVISKIKFKENDLIVKCYTESNGILSFLVKGVLSSKKSKLKPAYFQPLTMLKLEIDFKENRGLHYIKGARISNNYSSLHTVIFKSSTFKEVTCNSVLEPCTVKSPVTNKSANVTSEVVVSP